MSKIYAQKKPHETAGVDSTHHAAPAFSNQAMLDILKAPENVRAKPLSQEMNEKMSQHFGVSLSGIKVFENENLNQLGETAFAHGNEIHVAKGQYAPGTAHGQEVLMHEAAHVVQQGMGMTHGMSGESAALEAQAQSGGIMGNAATFSMPTATAAAPVQALGGGLWKKIKGGWNNFKSMFKKHSSTPAPAPTPIKKTAPAPVPAEPILPVSQRTYHSTGMQSVTSNLMGPLKESMEKYTRAQLRENPYYDAASDGGRFSLMRGSDTNVKEYNRFAGLSMAGKTDKLVSDWLAMPRTLPNTAKSYGELRSARRNFTATKEDEDAMKLFEQNALQGINLLLNHIGGNESALDAIKIASQGYESLGAYDPESNPGGLTGGKKEALYRALNDVALRTANPALTIAANKTGNKQMVAQMQAMMTMQNKATTLAAGGLVDDTSDADYQAKEMITKFFINQGLLEGEKKAEESHGTEDGIMIGGKFVSTAEYEKAMGRNGYNIPKIATSVPAAHAAVVSPIDPNPVPEALNITAPKGPVAKRTKRIRNFNQKEIRNQDRILAKKQEIYGSFPAHTPLPSEAVATQLSDQLLQPYVQEANAGATFYSDKAMVERAERRVENTGAKYKDTAMEDLNNAKRSLTFSEMNYAMNRTDLDDPLAQREREMNEAATLPMIDMHRQLMRRKASASVAQQEKNPRIRKLAANPSRLGQPARKDVPIRGKKPSGLEKSETIEQEMKVAPTHSTEDGICIGGQFMTTEEYEKAMRRNGYNIPR